MPAKPMTYRSLGTCGLKVSTFSIGGWTTFGESVKDLPRHERVIASKTFWPMSEDVNDRGLPGNRV
jgi:aryl-alcohol dehydrogenase-like predicted oxidoreductase